MKTETEESKETFCGTCDGTGRVRANYKDANGCYVFRKEECHECNGSGEGDAEWAD